MPARHQRRCRHAVRRLSPFAMLKLCSPRPVILATAACLAFCAPARAQDALAAGFRTPPSIAAPRVWWQWLNGNVTEEGSRLDLEWLKASGIGGLTQIDIAFEGWGPIFDTPRWVQKPLIYLSPQWDAAVRNSASLASQWGMEFGIDSSAGWNESGGPWVSAQQAMKKLVWSETSITGGRPFKGRLAAPPQTSGLFQNIPLAHLGQQPEPHSPPPTFYADVATVAYREAGELTGASCDAQVTTSAGAIDAARLCDGDLATPVLLPFPGEGNSWVQFSFRQPRRIQAITAVIGSASFGFNPLAEIREAARLEASDDGRNFRLITAMPRSGALQQTVAFPPVVARVWRVVLERPEPSAFEKAGLVPAATAHRVAELVLHSEARVNRFEDKAGYSTRQILEADDTPLVARGDAIRRRDVIDLTAQMHSDGTLSWSPPPGHWRVLRFGYSLIGRTNHPAPSSGTGLEVDKLSPTHVKAYVDAYLAEYEKALGPELAGKHALQNVTLDSYEAGAQNWTEDMLAEFKRRRGYDALTWFPVLAGRVVDSATASDAFLWDFRKTLAELITEAAYGQFASTVHAHGLSLYAESHESGRAFIGDGMEAKKSADIPMGAMWAAGRPINPRENYDADMRESASVAHIYGKPLVAGESFTSVGDLYGIAPQDLKPVADHELAMGANRFVISGMPHQPDSRPGPGLSMGPFGARFTRHETWAAYAGAWIQYLSRSAYLLQQGRFVADIAYLYGEDTNLTSLFHSSGPEIPAGYSFDFVDPDTLRTQLMMKGGRLSSSAGMQYRVLVLDPSTHRMSVPVLRKLRDLVRAGAMVVGDRPTETPSLADDKNEFHNMVAELWSDGRTEQTAGTGRVIADRPLAEVLATIGVAPDVLFTRSAAAPLRFVHRALQDGDLYFISNSAPHPLQVEASLRVSGKAPELWSADTAAMVPVSYRIENGRTLVPLELEANESVFVVFRQATSIQAVNIPQPSAEVLAALSGGWDVDFPVAERAPASVSFDPLSSWTESLDPTVKYFSGTATYRKALLVPAGWLQRGARVQLDLGEVKNVAGVFINGRSLGTLWKPPFRLDVTDALQVGSNRIEVRVTNLWANRLIGDKQPGAQQTAFASFNPFNAAAPLRPSGLLGPVRLVALLRK